MELPPRWGDLRPHGVQNDYMHSPHRFNVVPAGRRSGKTEIAKRKVILKALENEQAWTPRYFCAAPTRDQAKKIYWDDLKLFTRGLVTSRPLETELCIPLKNGAEIWVLGMDKPERIEGHPWDGGILDEYANMKEKAWGAHVRPALADRTGWCDLIGVPEGRNHYYDIAMRAQTLMKEKGDASEWGYFHWLSSDILPASEIEAAKADLDELTFNQEYKGSFVNFEGRAYYPFDRDTHTTPKLKYDKNKPLVFCFDFNVAPGIAVVIQEQELPTKSKDFGTGVIGEVYIPRGSNTVSVCNRLIQDWGKHEGQVRLYGDATGGASGSAQVLGSDWDLIMSTLRPKFGDRLIKRVKTSNPLERTRVNAVNTRLKTGSGKIQLMVDPVKAPHVVKDFEGVTTLKGGSGELDKKTDLALTHLTDAIGYYVEHDFPIVSGFSTQKLNY